MWTRHPLDARALGALIISLALSTSACRHEVFQLRLGAEPVPTNITSLCDATAALDVRGMPKAILVETRDGDERYEGAGVVARTLLARYLAPAFRELKIADGDQDASADYHIAPSCMFESRYDYGAQRLAVRCVITARDRQGQIVAEVSRERDRQARLRATAGYGRLVVSADMDERPAVANQLLAMVLEGAAEELLRNLAKKAPEKVASGAR